MVMQGATHRPDSNNATLKGRVALVTGATSGIGLASARELARLGAAVIFGVRDADKAGAVAAQIRECVPGAELIYPPAVPIIDFRTRTSVEAFATALNARTDLPIHILINNAGIAEGASTGKTNEEGIVDVVQVNYLAAYALTRLLEGKLVACRARVVNVTSTKHRFCELPSDPARFLTSTRHGTYPTTKAANVLFTYELQRRLGSQGLQACAVDPGGVRTAMWEAVKKPLLRALVDATYAPPDDAALVIIHAATVPWDKERVVQPITAGAPDTDTDTVNSGHGLRAAGGPRAAHAPDALDAPDMRLYARGMFASPLITHLDGAWAWSGWKTWTGLPMAAAYGASVLLHSLLDWPVRRWSGSRYMSTTLLVPSARQTYDTKLAAALWEASEVAAQVKLSHICSSAAARMQPI